MTKLELYRQMRNELVARRTPLINEQQALRSAAQRICTIAETLTVIDDEIAEYDSMIADLTPTPEPVPASGAEHAEFVDGVTRHMA